MENLAQYYQAHISELNQRAVKVLQREQLDGLVIHSGQLHRQFLDDMNYPFKVNPHFKAWLPLVNNPNCWLVINGVDKPILIFYRPEDFWHKVDELPQAFWTDQFDIKVLTKADQVASLLPTNIVKWAYVGEHIDVADVLGFHAKNPEAILNFLHFHRATKTNYELECLRRVNQIAVRGHMAAKTGFYQGMSEFEIQQAYLMAVSQSESDMPYSNIIALNENAAILHYTALEHQSPATRHSFLIDAGASYLGYAADITRTYSFGKNQFDALISAMDKVQLELIDMLRPSTSFTDIHIATHYKLAQVLIDFKLATGSVEQLVEQGVTAVFFPHGLGHMLGLQVHDMGGFLHDERGTHIAAPAAHPFLRCTRTLAANQVVTIEPGLYFIDSLLGTLQQDHRASLVNWGEVEQLKSFGGIRIEDNIIIHPDRNENMTREVGLID